MKELVVDFLDVGPTKYGDCILVRGGGQTILIDGAHPGDMKDQEGFTSIPGQLDALLGGARPHPIDLLVITHAHADHIGCLPALVDEGVITCAMSYVADERLGWSTEADALPDQRLQAALAVLREEGALTLAADAMADAIADAVKQRVRYSEMLAALDAQGKLIRCSGTERRDQIEGAFKGVGLRILGPSQKHLKLCHAQIQRSGRDAMVALDAGPLRDGSASVGDLLLDVAAAEDGALMDASGASPALNDQSIVLAFEFGGRRILLPGDMQFVEPEVTDLDEEMTKLRKTVTDHGPFDIVKTAHHTAYNGFSEDVGEEQAVSTRTAYLVHTGGRDDPKHPEEGALSAIRKLQRRRSHPLTFLRTDRNGAIAFRIASDGTITCTKSKGHVNDLRPNMDTSIVAPLSVPGVVAPTRPLGAPIAAVGTPSAASGDMVEVITRIPHRATRVTVTIDVAPGGSSAGASPKVVAEQARVAVTPASTARREDPGVPTFALPSDRQLPPLVFVTDGQALAGKIGVGAVDAMVGALTAAGQVVLNVTSAGAPAREVADSIRGYLTADIRGVVLLGDIDVVPSQRLDVLPAALRADIRRPERDPDNFIVWNDEVYGCIDADQIAELPVSRIPDGGSAVTLARALGARAGSGAKRFGIRNATRPFADAIFKRVAAPTKLKVSRPMRHTDLSASEVGADLVYLMLHGWDGDTSRFWGELENSGLLEAINLTHVPAAFSGVVLTGCCWGALTASAKASDASASSTVTGRSAAESLAVAFLSSGARAFVGCTGVHYSPNGASMHRAFLDRLQAGDPPALALFNAKRACLQSITKVATAEDLAIGLKIISQFTCLGLGW